MKTTQDVAAFDELDQIILQKLQNNARTSNAELARHVKLSPPAIHARIKRMEEDGVIRRYTAVLDREKLGFDMLCFVHVSLQLHQREQVQNVRRAFCEMPQVLECHHVTGSYDYLLKVAVKNRKGLEAFIDNLTPIQGVARIQTSMVLTEVKFETELPLED